MRLDAFRMQRGEEVACLLIEACGFGHRSRHRTPISGSVKYGVLTRAKGRCECCNAGKRDTDSTDFRGVQTSYARRERRCVPCRPT